MLHLVVDSATKYLYTAIYTDNRLLKAKFQTNIKDHTSFILKFISDLFTDTNYNFSDIEDITVGAGPGSYTGLRIAGVVAKMMANLLNKPLYKISSLYLLTSGYNEERLVAFDARNNRAFVMAVNNFDEISLIDSLNDNYEQIKKEYPKVIELNQDRAEDIIKIDFAKLIPKRVLVDSKDYSPNYCLETKAEQDYAKKNKDK